MWRIPDPQGRAEESSERISPEQQVCDVLSTKHLLINGIVPVTCDPKHFPEQLYPNLSWYEHAKAPLLNAEAMEYCFGKWVEHSFNN